MITMRNKLRSFMVRSARDVAAQALPNWAQIAASLAQNFYDVFVGCPDEDQRDLLEAAEQVSSNEWASIRGQVASELGERYAEALDQARAALCQAQGAARSRSRGEALRRGLNQTMAAGMVIERRRVGSGVARSVLMGGGASEPPPPSSWPQVPGFELTGWLGEGATAKVFVARRVGSGALSAPVALKVGALTDRVRFEREVELMTRARSPHLLSALSHGVIEGFVPLFWIEMPLMGGNTLADVGSVGLDEGVRLCLGVLEGLKALHQLGVAHRDLKPSNVLLTSSGEVKLADFGLSKRVGEAGASITTTGTVVGSPAYMSPEAINGERVGLSADVWSFGVLMCEVLAGHLPFPGSVAGQVWAAALRDAPDLSGLPQWMQEGVKACLAKSIETRPKDAAGLSLLIESPMRGYVRAEEERRAAVAQREARIGELREGIQSEAALTERAVQELTERLRSLSHRQVAERIVSLSKAHQERIKALFLAQRSSEQELARLEAEVTGAPLPDGLLRLEQSSIQSVKRSGLFGVSKKRTHINVNIEVYSIESVEFKLIQLPDQGVAMGQTQVTQALYEAVTGQSPSRFKGDQHPVEQVSWEDSIAFCNALSQKLGLSPCYEGTGNSAGFNANANGFRLPFENEWEWAARGGQTFTYAGSENLDDVGWYGDNSGKTTHPVGQKKANGYGFFDLSGNVWEWCNDDYENPGSYRPGAGRRVGRGGCWYDSAGVCHVAGRFRGSPGRRYYFLGLRLSRSL